MTDYKQLKLRASSSPHVRAPEGTQTVMKTVFIALLPALAVSTYVFGTRALLSALISVIGAIGFEWLYRKLLHKSQSIHDGSAALTGLLLAMTCPPGIPLWMLLVGDFFSIVVVKQLYGGLGKNFMNPALAGRAALMACYASAMTSWVTPRTVDAVTTATPLAMMGEGEFAVLQETYSLTDMFLGLIGGSMGEVSSLALLLGGGGTSFGVR